MDELAVDRWQTAWTGGQDGISLRVGPKGYIHGWIHVGVPAAGASVFHPHHGHGTSFGHSGEYVSVHFDSGHNKSFRVGHPVHHGERHGWSPGPKEASVSIEAAGTGGTSMGAFRRVKPVAHLERHGDTWEVRSDSPGHDVIGSIRQRGTGGWAAYEEDPVTGERKLAHSGTDFMQGVTAILGKPPYGHSWYRVTRGEPDIIKPRKRK